MNKPVQPAGYRWSSSRLGGGGYITGIIQNPRRPGQWFARCDVAGVFRSDDGACTWAPVNKGMRECHHHSVQSIAVSPHDPDLIFRCSGDAREDRIFGTIHRSCDAGETWEEVCREADYYGNGPTRMHGELIAVDPFRPAVVLAGSYSKGIWVSRDYGCTWNYTGLAGERIGCLLFHPRKPGTVYAGTISDRKLGGQIESYRDIPRGMTGKLYRSRDGGLSWELLDEGPDYSELAVSPAGDAVMYAACREAGIRRSMDGGVSWERVMNGLPEDVGYSTLAVSPAEPVTLYTIPNLNGSHVHLDPIAIYCSEDGGDSWALVKEHTESDLSGYPAYMTIRHAGWAVSKLRLDLEQPDRLLLANWYGVAVSSDGGVSWNANGYEGMETVCAEYIVCDRVFDRAFFIAADHTPSVSMDGGASYRSFPRVPNYTDSTAIAVSKFDKGFVLYGMRSRSKHKRCVIVRSTDVGKTLEVVMEFEAGFVQALAEDPYRRGRFYAYIDGNVESGAGLYRSDDWGKEWARLPSPFGPEVRTLPHDRYWIEEELLPVVVYQTKNVCGTNQLLRCDPHQPDCLVAGERSSGIYRSEDGGMSWTSASEGLPFGKHRSAVLTSLLADDSKPGVWYAGFLREGLWRSEDGGSTWSKLYPSTERLFNASSIACVGDLLALASEPLYGAPSESAVMVSRDNGITWVNVQDDRLGAIRWKSIDLDASGRIYGAACGNGCFVGQRK